MWEKIVKSIIPEIKAQVAETIKGAENVTVGDINITINVGGQPIHPKFPPGTDAKKIAKIDLTPELEELIENKIMEKLKAQKEHIESLPQREQLQFISDSSSATYSEVLSSFERD
ncbi:MAG: hypothetical protein ACFFG0_41840 [Candidatus Thorarchaeota archaeon]